jgi:hypothetical protein
MILRLPQTLNTRLAGGPLAATASHTNPLLDWSVRAFAAGTKAYVLLSNTRSLYSAVLDGVPGETRTQLAERVAGASTEPAGSQAWAATSPRSRCGSPRPSTAP